MGSSMFTADNAAIDAGHQGQVVKDACGSSSVSSDKVTVPVGATDPFAVTRQRAVAPMPAEAPARLMR